jgi:hypothetical protein
MKIYYWSKKNYAPNGELLLTFMLRGVDFFDEIDGDRRLNIT